MHLGSFFLGNVVAFGLSTAFYVLQLRRGRVPPPVLRLMAREETAQEDCRNAVQSLDLLQREVLRVGLLIGPAGDVATFEMLQLLASARGRVWAAITKLEGTA